MFCFSKLDENEKNSFKRYMQCAYAKLTTIQIKGYNQLKDMADAYVFYDMKSSRDEEKSIETMADLMKNF